MEIVQTQSLLSKVKNIALVILAAISILSLIFIFTQRTTPPEKFLDKIEELRDSVNIAEGKLFVLEENQTKLESDLYVKNKMILDQKRTINELKKRLNEKVDSVAHLDDKRTFEYITKYLSKRDSTQWR